MIFHSDKFIYDGVHSDDLGLMLVDTKNNHSSLENYGTEYREELQVDHAYGNNPFYVHKTNLPKPFSLEFVLVDSGMNPITWDREIEEKIVNHFMKDKFCEFISFDNPELTYYLYGIKATKKKNAKKEGILEIEFQPYYQYPIRKFKKNILIEGERKTELDNPCIIRDFVKPLLEIEVLEDCDFSIENKTINDGKIFKLTGLEKGNRIKVDNQLFIVIDDKDNNKFHLTNREWLRLCKGHNILSMKGKVRLKIFYNYEVRL